MRMYLEMTVTLNQYIAETTSEVEGKVSSTNKPDVLRDFEIRKNCLLN